MGFRTDAQTRPILITRVHEVLNSMTLWTRDSELVSELRTMEFDDSGVARARGKNKDDRVLALALALQGRHQAVYQTGGLHRESNKRPGSYDEQVWAKVKDRTEHGSSTTRSSHSCWNRGPRNGPTRQPRS